jgi:hypothetical protein
MLRDYIVTRKNFSAAPGTRFVFDAGGGYLRSDGENYFIMF